MALLYGMEHTHYGSGATDFFAGYGHGRATGLSACRRRVQN